MSEETTTTTPLSDHCVVPWQLGFYLGVGVDCLTGATMSSAINTIDEFTTTTTPASYTHKQFIYLCVDMDSTCRAFAANNSFLSNTYNVVPPSAVLATRAVDRVLYSPTTFSIIIRMESQWNPNSGPVAYRLTPAAAATLDEQGELAFRRLFGDYFVSSAQIGSSFDATLTFVCTTPEQRSDLLQPLRLQFASPSPLAGRGNLPILEDLTAILQGLNTEVSVSVHTEMRGVNGTPDLPIPNGVPVLDHVMSRLHWFMANPLPTSVTADLRSYAAVVGRSHITDTLPVPQRVFEELEELRNHLRRCSVVPGALLWFGNNKTLQRLQQRIETLQQTFSMFHPQLVSRDELRSSLLVQAVEVTEEVSRFNVAYDNWLHCYSGGSTAERLAATRAGETWNIGIGDGLERELEIERHSLVISVSKRPFSLPWRRALRFAEVTGEELSPPNADDERPQRIIGCRIVSRFGRGTCQVSNNFLLSAWQRNLPIAVSSGFLRREEWEIQVLVSRNPYLDALARLPPR